MMELEAITRAEVESVTGTSVDCGSNRTTGNESIFICSEGTVKTMLWSAILRVVTERIP